MRRGRCTLLPGLPSYITSLAINLKSLRSLPTFKVASDCDLYWQTQGNSNTWHKPGCVYLAAVQSSEQTSMFCQVMGGMYCKLTVNSLSVFMCGHGFSGLAGWAYINCCILWVVTLWQMRMGPQILTCDRSVVLILQTLTRIHTKP